VTVSVIYLVCDAGIAVDSPNAVVIGLAPSQFHYSQLNDAFRSAALSLHTHTMNVYVHCTHMF